jgi:hypothetical protein
MKPWQIALWSVSGGLIAASGLIGLMTICSITPESTRSRIDAVTGAVTVVDSADYKDTVARVRQLVKAPEIRRENTPVNTSTNDRKSASANTLVDVTAELAIADKLVKRLDRNQQLWQSQLAGDRRRNYDLTNKEVLVQNINRMISEWASQSQF